MRPVVMKIRTNPLILLLLCSLLCPALWAQSAKSDRQFAKGVGLYEKGKYRQAAHCFARADRRDKVEMDSTDDDAYIDYQQNLLKYRQATGQSLRRFEHPCQIENLRMTQKRPLCLNI